MEINICKNCNGSGEIKQTVGYHNSDWEFTVCNSCNGHGRVKTRSYSYSVPFDADNSLIYPVDSEIIKIIRDLELKCKNKI